MTQSKSPKEISLSWFDDVWNKRAYHLASELFPKPGVAHIEGGGSLEGAEDFIKYQREFLDAFPDMHVNVLDIIEEGSNVCTRWEVTATHTGEIMGLAATGNAVTFRGMTWHRIENGKIIEAWDAWNQATFMESLK